MSTTHTAETHHTTATTRDGIDLPLATPTRDAYTVDHVIDRIDDEPVHLLRAIKAGTFAGVTFADGDLIAAGADARTLLRCHRAADLIRED